MRDLPPQAQAIALEEPGLLAYELPAGMHSATLGVLPTVTTVGADTGPPGGLSEAERPHAAPVGIVRLLT